MAVSPDLPLVECPLLPGSPLIAVHIHDAAQATGFNPGTFGKLAVLSARAAAGLPLWNPDDFIERGPEDFR